MYSEKEVNDCRSSSFSKLLILQQHSIRVHAFVYHLSLSIRLSVYE